MLTACVCCSNACTEMETLRAERRSFGLDRWMQFKSAEVLYTHGLEMDKNGLGSPATRAAEGLHPAGVPKRRRIERGAPATPLPPRDPEAHTLVNVHKTPHALPKAGSYKNHRPTEWWMSGGQCCACLDLAKRHGEMRIK